MPESPDESITNLFADLLPDDRVPAVPPEAVDADAPAGRTGDRPRVDIGGTGERDRVDILPELPEDAVAAAAGVLLPLVPRAPRRRVPIE